MTQNSKSRAIMIPPSVKEYLPSSISKAVYRNGLTHPGTLYPVAVGAGCGVIGLLFGVPALYAGAVGGLIAGPLWAVIQIFFRHDKLGSQYINELNRRQKRYERHVKALIEKELNDCATIQGAESFAAQGLHHFQQIDEKLSNIKEILDLKVETTELTYGRFLGAAEQVSLSVLDNLKDITTTLKSAASIDEAYIRKRLGELDRNQLSETETKQKEALVKRLELKTAQFAKTETLLAKNEEAMTEMEKISAAVAEWQTDDLFSDSDFESAIARLQELAEQAHIYNKQ